MDLKEILDRFDDCHHSIQPNLETETNKKFHFPNLQLERRSDSSLHRSMYRKPTWNSPYINFYSWILLSRKRNLINSIFED